MPAGTNNEEDNRAMEELVLTYNTKGTGSLRC